MQPIEVTLGHRIAGADTARASLKINPSEFSAEVLAELISKGIYTVLQSLKAGEEFPTAESFANWVKLQSVETISDEVTRPKQRGRTVAYSQAQRVLDAKVLETLQRRAINFGVMLALPVTEALSLQEMVKNANMQLLANTIEVRKQTLMDTWGKMAEWDKLRPDELEALMRMRAYMRLRPQSTQTPQQASQA